MDFENEIIRRYAMRANVCIQSLIKVAYQIRSASKSKRYKEKVSTLISAIKDLNEYWNVGLDSTGIINQILSIPEGCKRFKPSSVDSLKECIDVIILTCADKKANFGKEGMKSDLDLYRKLLNVLIFWEEIPEEPAKSIRHRLTVVVRGK